MALTWDFKEKAGTVTQVYNGQEYTSNFYEGNALMIVTHEFVEDGQDLYTVAWFFCDKVHAERCLGLKKCDDVTQHNMFDSNGQITHLTIYREHCRQWALLVDLFTRAFPDAVIDVRMKAPDGKEGAQ